MSGGGTAALPPGTEAYGAFGYYFVRPSGKVRFNYTVAVRTSGGGPAQEADVSQAKVYKWSVSDANLLTTVELQKTGTSTVDIDISGYDPATQSPLVVQFVFEKTYTSGTRNGETDRNDTRRPTVALAKPAVAAISATPTLVKAGDTSQLAVTRWAALVYDAPSTPRLETGTAARPVPAARFDAAAKATVEWKLSQDGGTNWSPLATAETHGFQVTEAHAQSMLVKGSIGAQPNPPQVTLTGSRMNARLVYVDPADATRTLPFPQTLAVQVRYADNTTQDVTVGADGALRFDVQRSKRSMTFRIEHAAAAYVAVAPDAAAPRLIAQGDVDGLLQQRWKIFRLPEKWGLEACDWTITNAPFYVPASRKFERLDQPATLLGTTAAPIELKLNPHWQFLRFTYCDRIIGGVPISIPAVAAAPLLPPVIDGWRTKALHTSNADAPETRACWPIGADPTLTVWALPWMVQRTWTGALNYGTRFTASAKPDGVTILQMKRAEANPFIRTADDNTRTLVDFTDAAVRDQPSAERLRYYDLPKVWKSRDYFGWISDGASDWGRYEMVATRPTALATPLTFCFDDMVLTDEQVRPFDHTKPATDALHWPSDGRVAIFVNSFRGSGGSAPATLGPSTWPSPGAVQARSTSRWIAPNGLYNPDGPNNSSFFSRVRMQQNYIADYPHWTRLVFARGAPHDVFDKRLPDATAGVVGARAAVRWHDPTAALPASFHVYDWGTRSFASNRLPTPNRSFYPSTANDAPTIRPDLMHFPSTTNKFFSIQPYYEERHSVRYSELFNPANSEGTGRYDAIFVRACSRTGTGATAREVAVAISYFRFFFTFTATPPVGRNVYANRMCANIADRWNGDEAGGDPNRAWLVPQAADQKLDVQCLWFTQSLPRRQAHFDISVVNRERAGAMGSLDGTGTAGSGAPAAPHATPPRPAPTPGDDVPQAPGGWFTAAHEAGHAGGLPDEYNERWWGGSYGRLSWKYNTAGDAFEPDGRDAPGLTGSSVMNSNETPRNRHFWHTAEWVRRITTIPMMVKRGPYTDFKVPTHATPSRTYVYWPVGFTNRWEVAAGNRGRCSLFVHALGKDFYSQSQLQGSPYDGILTVTLNVRIRGLPSITTGTAAQRRDDTIALRTGLVEAMAAAVRNALNFKFYAHGAVGGATFSPRSAASPRGGCLIHFSPRFLDSDYIPENGEQPNAAQRTTMVNQLQTELEVELDTAMSIGMGPGWTSGRAYWHRTPAGALPEDIISQAQWLTDTGFTGAAADANLDAINEALFQYHSADVAAHDTRKTRVDAIKAACDTWLTTGDNVQAAPSPATVHRRPHVTSLKTAATDMATYFNDTKTSRDVRLEASTHPEVGRAFTQAFPSMLGIYKSAANVVAADLEPLVRQVIPGATVAAI